MKITLLLIGLVSSSCVSSSISIRPGFYSGENVSWSILVHEKWADFHLGDNSSAVRDYLYTMDSKGVIIFEGSSNDSFYVKNVMGFEWVFSEETITRRSKTHAPDLKFVRGVKERIKQPQ